MSILSLSLSLSLSLPLPPSVEIRGCSVVMSKEEEKEEKEERAFLLFRQCLSSLPPSSHFSFPKVIDWHFLDFVGGGGGGGLFRLDCHVKGRRGRTEKKWPCIWSKGGGERVTLSVTPPHRRERRGERERDT